jgi:hypothetical protein
MTTVAFQMVGSHARGHNLPRATGARRGVNNGAAKRAGDGDRAYPTNRHRDCIRMRAAFADFDLDRRGLRGRSRDGQASSRES